MNKARALLEKFEATWWYGGDTRSYADSLQRPGNEKVFQRHWIGLTPTDAVLPRIPGRAAGPLASRAHGNATLNEHEEPCYTDDVGLFHTGTGPTSATAGNPGPSCDSVVSTVPSERNIFTLNSAIAAVSEGNYGRLGADQQQHYINGNARSQLDPDVWEMPGAMPEIVAEPRFRRQHRPAVHRAVDGAAGLGRVRRALAGGAPVARCLTRSRPGPAGGGAAAAAEPADGVGPSASGSATTSASTCRRSGIGQKTLRDRGPASRAMCG